LIIDKTNDGQNENGIDPELGQCVVETGQCVVETGQCPVSTNPTDATSDLPQSKTPGELRFRNQRKDTLSSIIGSFKSIVTKHAHRIHADFEWQERFHDHIIRNEEEYCRIAIYIENNVTNWKDDKFYDP